MSETPLRVQVAELARRSIVQTLRQPLLIVPPILFPLVLVAVNASGLQAATRIPGFPTDNYVDFAIAVAFIQGALFAMINAGSALARDVETGFLRRLAMTPMQRPALLIGQLTGVILVAFFSALIYLAVGFLAGLHVKAGPGGVLALLALAMLIALGFAAIGALVGLRSGSAEAVQGFFPLFFVLLFLSSAFFPRDLIEQDWFRTIATYNPVSYMVEGIRSLVITGRDAGALWPAFAISGGVIVVFLALSARALKTRLLRT